MAYAQAKQYALHQAESLTRMELMEFFIAIHDDFYPEIEVKFMEYFLSIAEKEEFVVHHSVLVEYGVMTSTGSGNVKKRLEKLGFIQDQDYRPVDVSEPVAQGGVCVSKHYHLTPEAFKMCLMRAQRRDKQPIDPVIYVKYYLLLEKIFGLYRDYQAAYQERLLSTKDAKIDALSKDLKEMRALAHSQDTKMSKILDYAEDTKIKLDEMSIKLDSLFDFTSSFAKAMLSTWIGSFVFRTQVDQLIKDKDLTYALNHLKLMFTVAFYKVGDQTSEFAVYFCCTSFGDASKRIRELHKRHTDEKDGMVMMKPESICLISQEVNCERAKLQQLAFNSDESVAYNSRRKEFRLTLQTRSMEAIKKKYDTIMETVRKENFQGYQVRRDQILSESNNADTEIVQQIKKSDASFFNAALPSCQEYLDLITVRDMEGYKPAVASRRTTFREDIEERMTDTNYSLRKLNIVLNDQNVFDEIDQRIRTSVETQQDLKSLIRLSKAAAKSENVILSKEEEDQLARVEALPDLLNE